LRGRRRECDLLDQLLDSVRAGESRVLVVRGEPGAGKTALLDYLGEQASGCRVAHAAGVESEMELVYAGLHQLLTPMLDRLERLPAPQASALQTAFGLSPGSAPDRFLVGLAALSVLAEVAEEHPLVCLVDDAQWLDQASAQALGFVARRLAAESLGLVFAVRTLGDDLAGLPELEVQGLRGADARALLDSVLSGPLDPRVYDRIVAEAGGNPLALLELPRGLTMVELAGGFALPDAMPLSGRIEESFLRRLEVLPAETRRLLQLAAAEPVGDPVLMWRAAERLGIAAQAATTAAEAGLVEFGARVRFRHPLVRSAAYRSASLPDRQAVHRALAEATDPELDPDRRAWHWAQAAPGPDEEVAAELERSAGRAQARGGLAAAAAFLQRAVALTVDPARRGERALAAAEVSFQAGAFDTVLELLATAEASPLDGFQNARADLLRGHVAFVSGFGNNAAPLLLQAARQLEPYDLEFARMTYLGAYGAAMTAGHLGRAGVFLEICRAVRALPPPPGASHPLEVLLDALALLTTDGRAAATPALQRAAKAVAHMPVEDVLRWGWLAGTASTATWDSDGARAIFGRQARIVREAGALAELPIHLSALALDKVWAGDLAGAALLIAESDSVAAATGSQLPPFAALRLWSLQGREAEASALVEATIQQATAGGAGLAVRVAQWAAAVLYNGLGRYDLAVSAARQVTANDIDPYQSMWALPELVEAAARSGDTELAGAALGRLAATTQPAGTDFALGIEARSRALLTDGAPAEELYREAIDRLRRAQLRPELARAQLLLGEWLRRQGRRVDAREQLRTAHDLFIAIGMEAFAERARRELVATGETARRRTADTGYELTVQEALIARLAREGLSNREIGARLYISARTVQYHLGKVFTKLGISSRAQLDGALTGDPATIQPR
jgi:DNA-binding CsgD family transcriptional regulator